MRIRAILPTSRFEKRWMVLPQSIKNKAEKKIILFHENPFHPSLRLHQLSGKVKGFWSISVDMKYRIIIEIIPEGAILHTIGTHTIYEKM